jgi:hypothetical protein
MTNHPRQFWYDIVENEFAPPENADINELTNELLSYLASPDPELRDEFGYMVLVNWLEQERFTPDQMRRIINIVKTGMMVNLGETETDSVFLRSFSVLILGAVIYQDNQNPFLEAEEVKSHLQHTLAYFETERDLRGYVPEKGWAHAVAHTADTLLYLAQSKHLGGTHLQHILGTLAVKLSEPTPYLWQNDEDERLALTLMGTVERLLVPPTFYEVWLDRITQAFSEGGWSIERNPVRQNIRALLRSFYFQLVLTPKQTQLVRDVRGAVLGAINRIHRYVGK